MVESIKLDDFEGTVNLTNRTITVRLPEIYDASAMKVTELTLSDGATCDIQAGQTLNMEAAKVLHVKNVYRLDSSGSQ